MPFARIATVAAVTVLFSLTGCEHAPPTPADQSAPAATAVPKETVILPEPSPADVDAGSGSAGLDRFVAAVQRKLPEVALDRRDEELEDLGEQACGALKGGRGATSATGAVVDQGVSPADARTLVGLAKDTLCRS